MSSVTAVESDSDKRLPRPPQVSAGIRLTGKQKVGLPIILAIPILALFGVFGERVSSSHVSSPALDLAVSYPERFHYRQVMSLRASVRNVSNRALDTVRVSFDTAYIARFSSVQFDPPVRQAYTVDLVNLQPSESRVVSVELWGQDYWRHPGTVIARTGTDSVVARFQTIVFP